MLCQLAKYLIAIACYSFSYNCSTSLVIFSTVSTAISWAHQAKLTMSLGQLQHCGYNCQPICEEFFTAFFWTLSFLLLYGFDSGNIIAKSISNILPFIHDLWNYNYYQIKTFLVVYIATDSACNIWILLLTLFQYIREYSYLYQEQAVVEQIVMKQFYDQMAVMALKSNYVCIYETHMQCPPKIHNKTKF